MGDVLRSESGVVLDGGRSKIWEWGWYYMGDVLRSESGVVLHGGRSEI